MKRTQLTAHFCIPAIFTLGVFAVVLKREPFAMEMFFNYVFGGYLFYAAPYFLWAIVSSLAKCRSAIWHAGLVASSIALAAIASLWLGPRDPTGLPIQWMLYWPLAIVLQFLAASSTAIYCRTRKTPNSHINNDAA